MKNKNKPHLFWVVSACLLGHNTRYDGTNRKLDIWPRLESIGANFMATCPEYSTLGCPRLKAHLEGDLKNPQFIITKTKENVTSKINSYIENKISENIWSEAQGFILKARSPSCSPEFYSHFHLGPGLLALALLKKYPDKFIFSENIFSTKEGKNKIIQLIEDRKKAMESV